MFLTRVQWPAFAPGIIMLITETLIHPELSLCPNARVLFQRAARGVAMQDEQILLLFTERYNDFSFPGGGVDDGEDIITGLVREMEEETGARGVKVGREFARVDEKRPHWKSEFDVLHMVSHFHFCEINSPLQEVRMESYEIANGMRPPVGQPGRSHSAQPRSHAASGIHHGPVHPARNPDARTRPALEPAAASNRCLNRYEGLL